MFILKSKTEKTDGRLDTARRVLSLNAHQQKLSKLKQKKRSCKKQHSVTCETTLSILLYT